MFMKTREVNTDKIGMPAGHYCHAMEVQTSSATYYLSGQLPITPAGVKLNDKSFEEQVQQVFLNFEAVLAECGCTKKNLIQVRVYVTDVENWPEFDKLYGKWMDPVKPARCVVPVPALHYGCKLEMEGIAVK